MSIDVDPDWWKTIFDEVYLLTDARSVDDAEVTRIEVDAICDALPLSSEDRILDLCGGQGRHSLELHRRGFRGCTVLDYSEILIERGRSSAGKAGIEFIRGDASCTGLASESYDHVLILGNSLGYFHDEDADRRMIEEARRLLRPGGWLLIDVTDGEEMRKRFTPNAWHEIEGDTVVCRQRELAGRSLRAREMVLSKKRGLIRDRTYAIRLYDTEALSELVGRAGFEEIAARKGSSAAGEPGDRGFMNHRVLLSARNGQA